jgi:hypothetical protein
MLKHAKNIQKGRLSDRSKILYKLVFKFEKSWKSNRKYAKISESVSRFTQSMLKVEIVWESVWSIENMRKCALRWESMRRYIIESCLVFVRTLVISFWEGWWCKNIA